MTAWTSRNDKIPAYSEGQADLYSEPPERILTDDNAPVPPPAVTSVLPETYTPELDIECDTLIAGIKTVEEAQAALPRLKEMADRFPQEEKPAISYVSALEMTRQKTGLFEAWCDLHERFPGNEKVLRFCVRWLRRKGRLDEARAKIENALPGTPDTYEGLQQKVELYHELLDTIEVRRYHTLLVDKFPGDIRARHHFAKWLQENGAAEEAWDIFAPVMEHPQASKHLHNFGHRLKAGVEALQNFKPRFPVETKDSNIRALAYAIETFATIRRTLEPDSEMGAAAFITGSLGAGGAERQLARAVSRLETARRRGQRIAGMPLAAPVDVVVKSLDTAAGHDFFLADVTAAEARAFQSDNMPPHSVDRIETEDATLRALLPFLPSGALYGVQRMIPYFREQKVRAAYIWQDGAVLYAGLAALIAGVPRVVFCMRGLPPNLRLHMMRPEYHAMYRALSTVPGVSFIANNRVSADAYCDWIGMDRSRFGVVYNGVDFLAPDGDDDDYRRWSTFSRHTGGEGPVIGGVFRFEIDKRPLLWIDFARDYLKRCPAARFVLVGGGKQLAEARARASQHGIADRILFVGLSQRVGYWLARMDVFVLLSRFEGLPNVVIEAQLSGIPVVATPAGGTVEALVDGVSGRLLSSAENIDTAEMCDKVDEVYGWRLKDPKLGAKISMAASTRFSTPKMVENTAKVLSGQELSA